MERARKKGLDIRPLHIVMIVSMSFFF